MTESKKWWQSKTIWGILIAALGVVLTHTFKVDITLPTDPSVDQAQAVLAAVKASQGNVVGAILGQITTIVGLLTGLIGRLKAEKVIA